MNEDKSLAAIRRRAEDEISVDATDKEMAGMFLRARQDLRALLDIIDGRVTASPKDLKQS